MPPLAFFRSSFAAFALSLLLFASFAAAHVQESLHIPAGTILPVSIKHTFSSNDSSKNYPIEARIIAAADAYAAMTADRPYSPARTPHQAAAELRRRAGR
jgi:hypothetical protein